MTMAVTQSEILSGEATPPRVGVNAAVSMRARARIPVTQRVGNGAAAVRRALASWWAWTSRPLSLRAVWRLSAVDAKRIPGNAWPLRALWHVSNWTDRLALFALLLIAPTFLQGPLRWAATRPTRRWGVYLVVTAFAVPATIT